MKKDKIVRLIGFIVLIVSVITYVFVEMNKLGSFFSGLLTGLGFVCLIFGERVFRKWKL